MNTLHEFTGRMFGYVRVSTEDQNMNLQIDAMHKAGLTDDMIFSEYRSGKNMDRPQWKKLMRALRPGDCVVVWKMDRMGRTMMGVLKAIEDFNKRGVHLKVLRDSIDTTTPMGACMMHVSMAFAQLERDMIAERTKAGVASAKERGVKFGRQHYILSHPRRLKRYHELAVSGELRDMSAFEIVTEMNATDAKARQYSTDQSYKNWAGKGYPGAAEAFEAAGLAQLQLPIKRKKTT